MTDYNCNINSNEHREDSVITIPSSGTNVCRICHNDEISDEEMISPCFCSGSLSVVHENCLNLWIEVSKAKEREICKYSYFLKQKIRWEWLPLSSSDKKLLTRSFAYTLATFGLLIASIIFVIDNSMELRRQENMGEINQNTLHWRMWINLIVINFGCVGVAIFLTKWGNFYVKLVVMLIEYNRILVIVTSMSPPEKEQPPGDELPHSVGPGNLESCPSEEIDVSPALENIQQRDILILDVSFGDAGEDSIPGMALP